MEYLSIVIDLVLIAILAAYIIMDATSLAKIKGVKKELNALWILVVHTIASESGEEEPKKKAVKKKAAKKATKKTTTKKTTKKTKGDK